MKKNFLLFSLLFSGAVLLCCACTSDDNLAEYPKTVNVKFEMTIVGGADAIITTTINNAAETEDIDGFPYSRTYTQQTVEKGTYLKMEAEDNTPCASGVNCDYTAELSISVDNEVVKTEMFSMDGSIQVAIIDYTFQ